MPEQELMDKLRELMKSGDEAAARKFIVDHFTDFPAETQQDLAVEFFREAMANDLAEREALVELKKEALEATGILDSSKESAN